MKVNKKDPFFIFLLILTVLLFVFSYFFPDDAIPIFVFGMSTVVIFVFLYGLKGFLPAVGLVALAIAINYSKIDNFSLRNLVFGTVSYSALALIVIELRNVKDNLKISENLYKEVVERANDGIVIIQDELIKYVNPRIEDILGYNINEVIETDFKKYIAEKEVSKVAGFYQKRMKGEIIPSVYETILKHKNKGSVYVELSTGLINYKGKPADLVVIRDINQRKQIEDILHQREQEFKLLVEEAPDIIARFDKEHRCLYVNSAIEKELGIIPQNFFWKKFEEAGFSKKVSNLWEKSLDEVFESKKEKIIYVEQETIKGLKYYYSRLLPEYDKKGKIRSVLSITRDVTALKEIDRIKSEFITTASHQLRTPLSVIRWCSKSLLDETSDRLNEEEKGYLGKIYSSARKMIKITNAFLNVAILDLGSLNISSDIIDLTEVSEETLNEFSDKFEEKEIKIIRKYEENIPQIKADYRLLKIVLRGLISNAIKYSYSKGEISLEIKLEKDDILYKIGDNGHGIPEEQKENVFTKFFRAENVKDIGDYGIGLDLYIIKSIMENCGGKIWFESPNPEINKNKGVMFYFTLPLKGISKKKGDEGLIL